LKISDWSSWNKLHSSHNAPRSKISVHFYSQGFAVEVVDHHIHQFAARLQAHLSDPQAMGPDRFRPLSARSVDLAAAA
jgi:hypothetical protein